MTRLLLFLFVLTGYGTLHAQLRVFPGPPKPLTAKQEAIEGKNRDCIHRDKLPLQQRLKQYPFNKAVKVQIVSFDKPDSIIEGTLPIKDKKVDYTQLKEIKTLDSKAIDTLTDVLYNYGYRGVVHVELESLCYNPRNAILFVDSIGNTFAFIELCFECQGSRTSSKNVKTGDFCSQKYDLLKAFFARKAMAFGIKDEDDTDD
jgi:hypothetical protein